MKKVLITALVVLSLVLAVSCTTNYTVKFEANGGTPAPAAQTVAAGGVVVEPVSPAKTGYTFTGWYKDSTCATKYDFATKVNSNFTLYAGYDKNAVAKTYTVTFNSNGGSEVASQIVKEGECATRPLNPTKAGYEFVDWYTALGLEAGVAYSFTSKVESDLTLIAKWVDEAGAIIVTFNADGGTPAPGKQGADAAFYVTKPVDPVLSGYDFYGWFTDKACTIPFFTYGLTNDRTVDYSKVTYNKFAYGDEKTKVAESLTLYAEYIWNGDFVIDEGVLTGFGSDKVKTAYQALETIVLPEGITAIEEANLSKDGVFYGFTNLKTLVIPSTLEEIGAYAFCECTNLRYIVLANSTTKSLVETSAFELPANVTEIGKASFGGCISLVEVALSGVTEIGENAFWGCTSLETISLPKLTSLDVNIFNGDKDDDITGLTLIDLPEALFVSAQTTKETQNSSNNVNYSIKAPKVTLPEQLSGPFEEGSTIVISSSADITAFVGTSYPVVKEEASDGKVHVTTIEEIQQAVKADGASIILDRDIEVTGEYVINVSGVGVVIDLNGKKISYANHRLWIDGNAFSVYVYDLEDLGYFTCSGQVVGDEVNVVLAKTSTKFNGKEIDRGFAFTNDAYINLNGFTLTFASDYPGCLLTINAEGTIGITNGTIKQARNVAYDNTGIIICNKGELLLDKLTLNISGVDYNYATGFEGDKTVYCVSNIGAGELVVNDSYLTITAASELTNPNDGKLVGVFNHGETVDIYNSTISVDNGECTASSYGVYNYINDNEENISRVTTIKDSTINVTSDAINNMSGVFSEDRASTGTSTIYMRGSNRVNVTRTVTTGSGSNNYSYGLRAKNETSYIYWSGNVAITMSDKVCGDVEKTKEQEGSAGTGDYGHIIY